MDINYEEIGKRIAHRRKELGLKQSEVEEKADLSQKYLSNIERSISIPSIEVIMRIALALDTTPDEFLVGTLRTNDAEWKNVSEQLRNMTPRQLSLANNFLTWLSEQDL
nr:helix-turn-helix transcriptional regulator [uncultured Blautia sp.]